MHLKSLTIRNFRALQDIHLTDLPALAVLVGANGTGKSTFFDVFAFLRDALTNGVRRALDFRGGYSELVTRGHEIEPVVIEFEVLLPIRGKPRRIQYHVRIGMQKGHTVVLREFLRYRRSDSSGHFYFLDFHSGVGITQDEQEIDNLSFEIAGEPQELVAADILAIKGLGQLKRFKTANVICQILENWQLANFRGSTAWTRTDINGIEERLSETADNLPQVARYLFEKHHSIFVAVANKLGERVPGISAILPETAPNGDLILAFRDNSFTAPFWDRYVSDGTIKLLAYLILLHGPNPQPLLCVEEPETQLYPSLMSALAEEFRNYARRGSQVIISTHSPDLLNAIQLDEVLWLTKQNGVAEIRRAQDDPQVKRYMEEGDKMGYLWKEGFFTGVDPAA